MTAVGPPLSEVLAKALETTPSRGPFSDTVFTWVGTTRLPLRPPRVTTKPPGSRPGPSLRVRLKGPDGSDACSVRSAAPPARLSFTSTFAGLADPSGDDELA